MLRMFAHLNMKALDQSSRFLVFSVIDTLMASHRGGLLAHLLLPPSLLIIIHPSLERHGERISVWLHQACRK